MTILPKYIQSVCKYSLSVDFPMSDEIFIPEGFTRDDILSWGSSGLVFLDVTSNTVVKSPVTSDDIAYLQAERDIYEHVQNLDDHQGILHYHGIYETGLRLEYACNGNLESYLKNQPSLDFERRLIWLEQIASTLEYLGSHGVVHGDLRCANIFLDKDLNIKLADYAGSSLNQSPLLVAPTVSHRYLGPELSRQIDIFALGSVFYHIMTGAYPYSDLADSEIKSRYSRYEFPDTKSLDSIGRIIQRCWHGEYNDCTLIVTEIASTYHFIR